jgi:hypothetical protein
MSAVRALRFPAFALAGRHWRGEVPLWAAFWLNFVAVGVLVRLVEPALAQAAGSSPSRLFAVTVLYFLAFKLALYVWQAVGVLRSAEHWSRPGLGVPWHHAAQAAVVSSLVLVVVDVFGLIHAGSRLDQDRSAARGADVRPGYALSLIEGGRTLVLTGTFDFGLTGDLSRALDEHPGVRQISLDSEGGNVSEGRGVARLIRERGLDTVSAGTCSSACTIAFVSGVRRRLGPDGRLGFHGYRLESRVPYPRIDPEAELDRELEFFRSRRIDARFVDRIRAVPHDDIWFPSLPELLAAGVVDEILE